MKKVLKTYSRSTHDLSFAWRNTQTVGTLVPFMCEIGLPADTWDIELNSNVLTHPTVGPLFGSFKWQLDVFTCPMRLYNSLLHNNALNIGLDMSKVKLPKFEVAINNKKNNKVQINQSALLSYLGRKGFGNTESTTDVKVKFNATSAIAYYDIFKNYYANKQEGTFKTLGGVTVTTDPSTVSNVHAYIPTDPVTIIYNGAEELDENEILSLKLHVIANITNITHDITATVEELIRGVPSTPAPENGIILRCELVTVGTGSFTIRWTYSGFDGSNQTIKTLATESKIINIQEWALTDIDKTREVILMNKTEVVIGNNGTTGIPGYLRTLISEQEEFNSSYPQVGLCLKTYQSDIFNNWINTEWIDGENGINAITAIDTSNGNFTLDTLNLSKKVYDMLNRIAVSGGTYQDWIETVYTNDYIQREETPVYQGGMSDEIVFQEVISNSATEDEPLGSLAGRGKLQGNKKGGTLHIKINEPCYIIGICSITPRVDYCQGNRYDTDLDTLNDLHKPALDGIGFQDLTTDRMYWRGLKFKQDGTKVRKSVGKQPAWLDYMTNYNKTFGNFAIEDNEAFMCLNRFYALNNNGDVNVTSYIDPRKYNYIFADTSIDAMNFWVQIGVGATVRRMISAKVIPNL